MSRRGMQVKALLSMGLLAGFGAVSTLAAWTGEATATSSIQAGTVAIGVGATADSASGNYTLPPSNNWYPGVNRAVMVTVRNTGTLAAPFAISGTTTPSGVGTLGESVQVKVTRGAAVGNATCDGATVLEKTAGNGFSGSSAPQLLTAGEVQAVCVQYSLPITAPSALQGKSATVTLTFTATVGVS
ncbi:hypothetical protein AS189_16370 [Arthrobacter alpinus]|uniref:SipW-cognate class signal peptide n=1 Tax=Arthrobacter alpinus TaxID=656366 RepID=A0A0S2M260_9MICC|nr:hypothetical protein [Arthrobacter alpinus]ALO67764.1 hypothetical protein AS189_16370 [Arthrobacter alpinus]